MATSPGIEGSTAFWTIDLLRVLADECATNESQTDNVWTPTMSDSPRPAGTNKTIVLPGFGSLDSDRIVDGDRWFLVIRDKYPLTQGHSLIIPRRTAERFQNLTTTEKKRLLHWIEWTRDYWAEMLTPLPDGFNLGANDGVAAGQTIEQFHFHVIPRYPGDVPDARGGIRLVISSAARHGDTHCQ